MASPPPEANALSVHRTFVVQLHVGATDGRYSGRVEHVVSGRALQFSSLEDLLEFMEQPGEAAADGAGTSSA
jgi:hypothetical protein